MSKEILKHTAKVRKVGYQTINSGHIGREDQREREVDWLWEKEGFIFYSRYLSMDLLKENIYIPIIKESLGLRIRPECRSQLPLPLRAM